MHLSISIQLQSIQQRPEKQLPMRIYSKIIEQINMNIYTLPYLVIYQSILVIYQLLKVQSLSPNIETIFNNRIMNQQENNWEEFTCLHPQVVASFRTHNLNNPTKVQIEVFSQYRNYYDFLIASQTGSGKTFAFVAPIVSDLMFLEERYGYIPQRLMCLILTPTRQLAQQIEKNISMITKDTSLKTVCVVGGLSRHKQLRVINQVKPQIIVATPGRLNQLLQQQIVNFECIKFLVLDEADRMMQLGHFVQVDNILSKVFTPKLKEQFESDFHQINQAMRKRNKKSNKDFYIKNDQGKIIPLKFDLNAVQAEQVIQVPLQMFHILDEQNQSKTQPKNKKAETNQKEQALQMIQQEKENQSGEQQNEQMNVQNFTDDKFSKKFKKQSKNDLPEYTPLTKQEETFINPMKRKIFFISATLTRQFKGTKYFQKKKFNDDKLLKGKSEKGGKDKGKQSKEDKDQGFTPKLKALMSVIKFNSKPKIIDLSATLFLPDKLRQKICYCDDDLEKTTIVICYLQSLDKNAKTIIFANTIKCAKRIQFFVESFGFRTMSLHSHMQQKQRIKKLERFKSLQSSCVMIATDVAARGLDFFISNVIQYNIPINGDTYVHRIGRTARANRSGQSLTMIQRKQASRWNEINEAIGERKLDKYLPQQRLIDEISQKVNNFEWIRRNNKQLEQEDDGNKIAKQADQLGVQYEQQRVIPRQNRIDNQEKTVKKSMIKRQIAELRNQNKRAQNQENQIQWRKNKMVVSLDEIRRYL